MTKEDVVKLRMLKAVIDQGEFKVKGEAIIQVANLLVWFNNLEKGLTASSPVTKTGPVKKAKK